MTDHTTPTAFFAAPFSEDFRWVRSALAAACRELKIDFRAVDETVQPGESIIDAINYEIAQCNVGFAVITGFNANVMYELGLLHSLSKPTVILADVDTVAHLPFDLRSRMVVRYDASKKNEDELKLVVIAATSRLQAIVDDEQLRGAIATGTSESPPETHYESAQITFGAVDFDKKKQEAERASGQEGCETRNIKAWESADGKKGWRLKAKCRGGVKMDVFIDINGDIQEIDIE